MELTVFSEFGIVIGLAAVLGIIASKLRQPAILGYIICGLLIGPLSPGFHPSDELLQLFAKIGITFLLFVLGLELNLQELKSVGKVALATGLGQILFTSIIGYVLCILLGFSSTAAIYIAIALTFSSTIIIIKLLSNKKQLDTLFGRISVGFLLVQDLVAILIIIGLSAFKTVGDGGIGVIASSLGLALVKGIVCGIGIFLFTKFILNPVLNSIKNDREVLFLTVIAWALLLAMFMSLPIIGFSIEVGGLLAGIALANRFEHLQIESWTKPLRDFFITLFFVMLGFEISIDSISTVILPAILLSFYVLVGNPLLVLVIMGMLGYSSKVSFYTSLAVAQISEFSLIVTKFGYDLGHVDSNALTLVTLIGAITMVFSTYLISYNDQLYERFQKVLKIFEKKKLSSYTISADHHPDIILFGCHRMGKNLLKDLHGRKDQICIVDYDSKVVKNLIDQGYDALYGDITDDNVYEKIHLIEARIVISTIPSIRENRKLLNYINTFSEKPMTVITATEDDSAKALYDLGADFVIYPHMLGSQLLTNIVAKGTLSKSMVKLRGRVIESLNLN